MSNHNNFQPPFFPEPPGTSEELREDDDELKVILKIGDKEIRID